MSRSSRLPFAIGVALLVTAVVACSGGRASSGSERAAERSSGASAAVDGPALGIVYGNRPLYPGSRRDPGPILRDYEPWLGREVTITNIGIPAANVKKQRFDGLGLDAWSSWTGSGRRLAIAVPMVGTRDPTKGGTATVVRADDVAANLREGASGRWDAEYAALGAELQRVGLGRSDIAIAIEAQGDWYPDQYGPDVDAWVAYWQHIVTAMRSGAPELRFVWVMGLMAFTRSTADGQVVGLERAWPGDAWVDAVGFDLHDGAYPGEYPRACAALSGEGCCPDGPTGCPITAADQRDAWDHRYLPADPTNRWYGLDWWADFAAAHRKPIVVHAWGISRGGDNAIFVQRFWSWVVAHDVEYATYDADPRAYSPSAPVSSDGNDTNDSNADTGGDPVGRTALDPGSSVSAPTVYTAAPCAYLQTFGGQPDHVC